MRAQQGSFPSKSNINPFLSSGQMNLVTFYHYTSGLVGFDYLPDVWTGADISIKLQFDNLFTE